MIFLSNNSDARYICPKVACEENLTIEDGKPVCYIIILLLYIYI